MENIEVKVRDVVLKPAHEVFEAIVNQDKLSEFFISRASGPIKQGEAITWFFDDVGGELLVTVRAVIQNTSISFDWAASGVSALVDIQMESITPDKTSIVITEKSFPLDKDGVSRALGQTQGWTDFICCMKAFLYKGINLREGRSKADNDG